MIEGLCFIKHTENYYCIVGYSEGTRRALIVENLDLIHHCDLSILTVYLHASDNQKSRYIIQSIEPTTYVHKS